MLKKIVFKSKLSLLLGILALDSAFFMLTDPNRVSSILLMVGFLLIVATIYVLFDRLYLIAQLYGLALGSKPRRFSLIGTIVVAGLVGLQSMGELTARDLLVVVPLAIIMYLYLSYGKSRARSLTTTTGTN